MKNQIPQMKLSFSFFLCLSIFLLMDRSGIGAMCLMAALLHELGHFAALAAFHVKTLSVRFCPFGIRIEREETHSLLSELVINLAGPVTNIIMAGLFALMGKMPFSAVNCALGIFHLCPLPMLDGGQALACLLQKLFPLRTAERIGTIMETAIFVLILTQAFRLLKNGANFTLLLLLAGLALMILFGQNKSGKTKKL